MTRRHAIRDEATAREGAELHDRVRGVGAPAAGAERLDLALLGPVLPRDEPGALPDVLRGLCLLYFSKTFF